MDYVTYLRQFRIGPFAVFDTVLGYLAIFLLAPLLTKTFTLFKLNIPRATWLWWMFPLSVVFHLAFNQQTPVLKTLADPLGFFVVSAVLAVMFFMGLKSCSRIKSKRS
jgi:hypothetical protein